MPTPKYLAINSDSPEDIQELFEAICHDVLKLSPLLVKKRAMGFIGKDTTISNRRPTLLDVLKLCQDMDIPYKFNLKLSYEDSELTIDERKSAKRFRDPDFREGYRERDLEKKLEQQATQLTNPELRLLERREELKVERKEEKKHIAAAGEVGFRPDDILDFPPI